MARKVFLLQVLLFLFASFLPAYAHAQRQVGIAMTDEGAGGFYMAVRDYFDVPEREVIVIKEKKMRDEEIPVVFFIARRARVPYLTVVNLRLSGMSWIEIALKYGLTPDVFYVPGVVVTGPPYGRAYGYYRNKPRHKWKTIILTDGEVIDLVNLRFISEHYRYPADKVVRMRGDGKSFVIIDHEIRREIGQEVRKGKEERPQHRGKKERGRDEER
ncbi:MAG: hypothetical protein HY883_06815 [Deltaproteobacteria bacterium]|nr:hypothetical protein [Deltaproteobacteria bacterium]